MRDDVFERHRRHLTGVAYRLLGSWHDAEDVVSEAWLRWQRAPSDVRDARGWLTRVVARLALDELRSARARREAYIGPWLPEPLVTSTEPDPADAVAADESVRLAFVAVLEQLSPEQRIAFVLHDVLDVPFAEVASTLDCSEETARQHASRGRRRVRDAAIPEQPPPGEVWRVLEALSQALYAADTDALARLLRHDVTLVADGGGVVAAAGRPLHGAEVGRFLLGLTGRYGGASTVEPVLVNGEPGLLVRIADERPRIPSRSVSTVSLLDGRIAAMYTVVAPAKLSAVPP